MKKTEGKLLKSINGKLIELSRDNINEYIQYYKGLIVPRYTFVNDIYEEIVSGLIEIKKLKNW